MPTRPVLSRFQNCDTRLWPSERSGNSWNKMPLTLILMLKFSKIEKKIENSAIISIAALRPGNPSSNPG